MVTGSSSGIGTAIARELALAGCNLIVHGHRRADQAVELAGELQRTGSSCETLECNFADRQQVGQFVAKAWEIAPLDIWVNNAGADVLTGSGQQLSYEEKLDLLWNVDVAATVRLSREVGHRMQQRGSGAIVNIGWDQAELGMAGESGELFATTKGAVTCFSRSLAKSLAPQVRVNCIAPGWIKTAWGKQADEYWQQRAQSESLLQRWGTPDDVARAAVFLASDQAEFITGQVVALNGGRP